MHSRWYNAAVIVAWLVTMYWLMNEKVLPPLRYGEPPSYREVIEAQSQDPVVGWQVTWKGSPLGWALTNTKLQSTGLTEIHGRVHFNNFPVRALMPTWLQPFVGITKKSSPQFSLDAGSMMLIDTFGRLMRFDSAISMPPLLDEINVRGAMEGGDLQLVIRSGGQSFSHEISLPPKALVSDSLSPQTRLPGLHIGQRWSVPVLNPIWPSKSPMEIISATVESSDVIMWDGEPQRTLVVVYRRDTGTASKGNRNVQGRLWVRGDGVVLRQEAMLFDSSIVFVRMNDKDTKEFVEKAGSEWWELRMGRRR